MVIFDTSKKIGGVCNDIPRILQLSTTHVYCLSLDRVAKITGGIYNDITRILLLSTFHEDCLSIGRVYLIYLSKM